MIITIIIKTLNSRTASTCQPVWSDAMVHEVACVHHNASNPAKFMHLSCIQDRLQAYQLYYTLVYYLRVSLIEILVVCMFTNEIV